MAGVSRGAGTEVATSRHGALGFEGYIQVLMGRALGHVLYYGRSVLAATSTVCPLGRDSSSGGVLWRAKA